MVWETNEVPNYSDTLDLVPSLKGEAPLEQVRSRDMMIGKSYTRNRPLFVSPTILQSPNA